MNDKDKNDGRSKHAPEDASSEEGENSEESIREEALKTAKKPTPKS